MAVVTEKQQIELKQYFSPKLHPIYNFRYIILNGTGSLGAQISHTLKLRNAQANPRPELTQYLKKTGQT